MLGRLVAAQAYDRMNPLLIVLFPTDGGAAPVVSRDVSERGERAVDVDVFANIDVKGKAVLIQTSWDTHWRTDKYFAGHPFLTKDAAQSLADQGTALVGIDSYNIDSTTDGNRHAHSILLGHDIPIVEHLCGLGDLPDAGFKFFAVPVKVKRFGTFPVRAFGLVPRIRTTQT